MSNSSSRAITDRPTTSSLPVKPVTPRTWNKLQSEAASTVNVFDNEMYGQGPVGSSVDKDTNPGYQPLSARSVRYTDEEQKRPMTSNGNARPQSRLGVPRGAPAAAAAGQVPVATSKFVVPPLNMAAVHATAGTPQQQQRDEEAKKAAAASVINGSHALYLRNQGLPVIPDATGSGNEAPAAAAAKLGKSAAPANDKVRTSKIKLHSSGLVKGSNEREEINSVANGDGNSNAADSANTGQLRPETSSLLGQVRPSTRLGRPLSSLGPQAPPLSRPASQSKLLRDAHCSRRSKLPDFTGTYRSSDHNELLIKASGWVERPHTSTGDGSIGTPTSQSSQRPSVEATAAWVAASKSFVLNNNSTKLRDGSFHGAKRPSSATLAAGAHPKLIIPRLSNYEAARRFLLAPGPINEPLKCRVERRKAGILGTTMHYVMLLEEGECVMLTARRYRRANGAAAFDIFVAPTAGSARDTLICVAKLTASFMGTEYVLVATDAKSNTGTSSTATDPGTVTYGFSESSAESGKKGSNKGGEMGAITYTSNILGTKGPRKAMVVLPKLVPAGESAWELQPGTVDGPGLISTYKQGASLSCIVLHNRPPRWNAALGAYCLHFGGRVTHASVKNIQLVSDEDPDRVLFQFGRVGADEFTLDYQFPITPLQAFAIGLASLDPKLGCE